MMDGRLGNKLSAIKEKLLDPFNTEGLEEEFEELYNLMKNTDPEELRDAVEEFEEIRDLLYRNVSIIVGGLKPLLGKLQEGIFSRRV